MAEDTKSAFDPVGKLKEARQHLEKVKAFYLQDKYTGEKSQGFNPFFYLKNSVEPLWNKVMAPTVEAISEATYNQVMSLQADEKHCLVSNIHADPSLDLYRKLPVA